MVLPKNTSLCLCNTSSDNTSVLKREKLIFHQFVHQILYNVRVLPVCLFHLCISLFSFFFFFLKFFYISVRHRVFILLISAICSSRCSPIRGAGKRPCGQRATFVSPLFFCLFVFFRIGTLHSCNGGPNCVCHHDRTLLLQNVQRQCTRPISSSSRFTMLATATHSRGTVERRMFRYDTRPLGLSPVSSTFSFFPSVIADSRWFLRVETTAARLIFVQLSSRSLDLSFTPWTISFLA